MIRYAAAPVEVRPDLVEAHDKAWLRLARPGAWLDSATRLAVAAETRHAAQCALCKNRKAALPPSSVSGRHDSLRRLPECVVEQIHAIVSDPGRLTRKWFDGVLASGTSDAEYVE